MKRRSLFALPLAAPLMASQPSKVSMGTDGVPLSPQEFSTLLAKLPAEPDSFSRSGVVEQIELSFAKALGKEYAVWMPTGTLANHLAIRLLAGNRRRVLLQHESHLFNDCGDCAQTLSGLHLIPLAPHAATFRLEDVEQSAHRAAGGRVQTEIGALQIETPVRRRSGEAFDFEELKKICAWARERKIGTHLDGARLYIASAYSGIPVRDYASHFDTVYVSLYKYFNAGSGAILAGPKAMLQNAYHIRRMFGGGLNQVWPFASVALHFFDGFEARYSKAVQASESVIAALANDGNFEIQRIAKGTNIFRFRVRGVNGPIYHQRLEAAGIAAPAPEGEWYSLRVNETWNRMPPSDIVNAFRRALG